jgi:hypothetical protein
MEAMFDQFRFISLALSYVVERYGMKIMKGLTQWCGGNEHRSTLAVLALNIGFHGFKREIVPFGFLHMSLPVLRDLLPVGRIGVCLRPPRGQSGKVFAGVTSLSLGYSRVSNNPSSAGMRA